MNLLDTIALFGTVVLAAPIGLLGIEFLLDGRLFVGTGFLAVSLALVAGGYFRPSLKGILAGTVVDTAADGDREDDGEGDEEAYKDRA